MLNKNKITTNTVLAILLFLTFNNPLLAAATESSKDISIFFCNQNIRIAPTQVKTSDLKKAMDLFVTAVQLAS